MTPNRSALTVKIFSPMLSSGAGSLFSRRWLPRTELAWVPLALVIAALVADVVFLPQALALRVNISGYWLLISGGLLAPLGFAMGMPFPTGLRALAANSRPGALGQPDNAVEWAWAMNAAWLRAGICVGHGDRDPVPLNVTLACGVAAYALALLLLSRLHSELV